MTNGAGHDSLDRRTFLKIAGAGAVAGGLGATAHAAEAAAPASSVGAPAISRQLPDVAVIGAGAFGCWTALHLRRMGATVTLIDEHGPGNARATSGDETRGIRTGYGDNELWTRWASECVGLWRRWSAELDRELGTPVYFDSGDLIFRSDWEPFTSDTRATWDKLGIEYEVLTPAEVHYRWPGVFKIDDINVVLHEKNAGIGRARRTCEAVAALYKREGGTVRIAQAQPGSRSGERMTGITLSHGDPVSAGLYVFACGPWLGKVFPDVMGRRIRTPLGYVVYYNTPPDDHRFTHPNMPTYNFPGVTGWPGLPVDNRGFRVRTGGGGTGDPETSDRWVPEASLERPRTILRTRFPVLAEAPINQTHACHYELSPNRQFLMDTHPEMKNVWLVGTGNAEGFKFSLKIGEYAANRMMGRELEPALATEFRLSTELYEPTGG